MANSKKTPPLESFYRLVIMLGSAVVGGMALQVYGPPPDKLGPIFERAKIVASDLTGKVIAAFNGNPPSQPPFQSSSNPPGTKTALASTATPVPAAPPFRPQDFRTPAPVAVGFAPPAPPSNRSTSVASALAGDPSLAPLVARLESAGVDRLELVAWGADGRLVRGSCTALRPGSAFRRMLDAIEASPRAALENLLARVETPDALAQAY